MLAKKDKDGRLFEKKLDDIVNKEHPLCKLANKINWKGIEEQFKSLYREDFGRPAKEIRLMILLLYLKYEFNISDEGLPTMWIENPYWQYFSGEKYFQHEFPIEPSLLSKFRKRAKSKNLEKLLEETIKTGLKLIVINEKSLEETIADTTVQEKNITFPTDAKLYYKMIIKLVKLAKLKGIKLRQSYIRVSKRSLFKQSRYMHTRKEKLARKEIKKLKTLPGQALQGYFKENRRKNGKGKRIACYCRKIIETEKR